MSKTDLIERVAKMGGTSKKEAESAVKNVLDAITDALHDGEVVQIIGFGTFEVKDRAARTGRNPATGEDISIPATRVPVFKAGKALKEAVGK